MATDPVISKFRRARAARLKAERRMYEHALDLMDAQTRVSWRWAGDRYEGFIVGVGPRLHARCKTQGMNVMGVPLEDLLP